MDYCAGQVACEYVSQPVLCDLPDHPMVKFSLQFLVSVRSISPLELFIHDNYAVKLAKR